ncbi:hypothetical protein ACA910_020768 [Epithemia clementina (nom. ined.)]
MAPATSTTTTPPTGSPMQEESPTPTTTITTTTTTTSPTTSPIRDSGGDGSSGGDDSSSSSSTMILPMVSDFTVPSRNRTLLLARLNMAAFPTCQERLDYNNNNNKNHDKDNTNAHVFTCTYDEATLQPIWQAGQSMFGKQVTNLLQEQEAMQQLQQYNQQAFQSGSYYNGAKTDFEIHNVPYDTAEWDIGVHAVQWTVHDPYNTTILAFRGSFTPADNVNIENWILPYILSDQGTTRMQQAWTQDAGLTWTPTQQQRHDDYDDTWVKLEIRTAQSFVFGQQETVKDEVEQRLSPHHQNNSTTTSTTHEAFAQRLVDAVQANASLAAALQQDNGGVEFTVPQALQTGYWTLTRYLIRQVAQQAQDRNYHLLLTGHSQGGTRAQLASMHLHQQAYSSSSSSSSSSSTTSTESSSTSSSTSHVVENHSTITFGASGSACLARQLWYQNNAALLTSVNPFLPQNQLTDYVHPLDPWGNALLGRDNGGHVCFWGSTNAVRQQEAELEALERQKEKEAEEAEQAAEAGENGGGGGGDGDEFGDDDDDDDDEDNDTTIPVIDPAYIYCSRIYGYRGPLLMAADAHAPLGHFSLNEQELRQNFERCRYYTHTIEATLLALSLGETLPVLTPGENDNVTSSTSTSTTTTAMLLLLQPDGTTDGGCHSVLVIPQDDPMQLCPAVGDSGLSQSESVLALELIIGIVVGSLLCLCCTYQACVWFCCRRRRRRAKKGGRGLQRVQQYEDDDGYRDNNDNDDGAEANNHASAILAAAQSGDDQDEADALWNQRSSRSNPEFDSLDDERPRRPSSKIELAVLS